MLCLISEIMMKGFILNANAEWSDKPDTAEMEKLKIRDDNAIIPQQRRKVHSAAQSGIPGV